MNCDETIPPMGEIPCRPIYFDPLTRYQQTVFYFIGKYEHENPDQIITSILFNEREFNEMTLGYSYNTFCGKPIVLSKDVKRGHFGVTFENKEVIP